MDRFISVDKKTSNDDELIINSNLEPDLDAGNPIKKIKVDYNSNRKFKEEWKRKFKWLDKDLNTEKPYCESCKKFIIGGISHIERHEKTNTHEINYRKAFNTPTITTYYDNRIEKHCDLVKTAELKLTVFLHEHNLPFSLMDHLPGLLKSVCPDSKIAKEVKCARTKATALTTGCLAQHQLDLIKQDLKNNVFSVIIDETTDIGTVKSLALVVRYFNNNEWKDRFFGLIKLNSCTAEDLFSAICAYFEKLQIPIENLIGFACDNASVMMGNINGVQARFKHILPNIFVLGCVCHSFHLCSSSAEKKLPRSLEDFIRGIYNYFTHSCKRLEKLLEFQVFLELKPHKLLHPSQTRWLSLQAAINRVLENWNALVLFFTEECFQDNLHSTQSL